MPPPHLGPWRLTVPAAGGNGRSLRRGLRVKYLGFCLRCRILGFAEGVGSRV